MSPSSEWRTNVAVIALSSGWRSSVSRSTVSFNQRRNCRRVAHAASPSHWRGLSRTSSSCKPDRLDSDWTVWVDTARWTDTEVNTDSWHWAAGQWTVKWTLWPWTATGQWVASVCFWRNQVALVAGRHTVATHRRGWSPSCRRQRVQRDCAVTRVRHSRGASTRSLTDLDWSAAWGETVDWRCRQATPNQQRAPSRACLFFQTWVSVWTSTESVDVKQPCVEMDRDDYGLQMHRCTLLLYLLSIKHRKRLLLHFLINWPWNVYSSWNDLFKGHSKSSAMSLFDRSSPVFLSSTISRIQRNTTLESLIFYTPPTFNGIHRIYAWYAHRLNLCRW